MIIDAHLDLSWNALSWGRDILLELDEMNRRDARMQDHAARGKATVSLPEMKRANIPLCLGTFLARANPNPPARGYHRLDLDYPMQDAAYGIARGQLAYYRLLEKKGWIRRIEFKEDLDAHWSAVAAQGVAANPLGMILAMEGADSIVEPEQAEDWFNEGLRSVNIVHYGRNRYATGTGANGPLTDDGVKLVKEFDRLGMIIDATHLSDISFFQTLDLFGGAVLASHNNCRSLVPADRQFSDEQIRLLVERGAVIGAALDAWMLSPNWKIGVTNREVVSTDAVADHIDHICQLAGSCRHSAIGSDLDGGFGTEQTPTGLDSIADLHKLDAILTKRGYSSADIDAIFFGNWLRFFREHLPSRP